MAATVSPDCVRFPCSQIFVPCPAYSSDSNTADALTLASIPAGFVPAKDRTFIMCITDSFSLCPTANLVRVSVTVCVIAVLGSSTLVAQAIGPAAEPPVPGLPFRLEVALQATESNLDAEDLPVGERSEAFAAGPLGKLTLDEVEQLALSQHPAVREAIALRDAARSHWLQVGLYPNLSAGYSASEVGNDGRAGQQGGYVGQTFVRGGKLQLNRAVASHEIVMRQQDVVAAQQKVLTEARIAFYDLLVLQDRAEILQKLHGLTQQASVTAKQLFEARESPKTDYLQAQVEMNRIQLDLQTTRVSRRRAQQVLATRIALNQLPATDVVGNLEDEVDDLDWQAILDQILAVHPDVLKAFADVERARAAVARAQAEVVPDLESQGTVQYDAATQYTVVGIQAVVSVPLWNRNQGGISAAWAELRRTAARRSSAI